MKRRNSYWKLTKSPFYSFVFTLPLFGIYEVMTLFLSRDQLLSLRNGADALFRQFLGMFGIWGPYVLSILFIFGFMIAFLWQKAKFRGTSVRGDYLIKMLLEGSAWGILLYVILRYAPNLLMLPSGKMISQQIVLSIGAGLYEEMLFRVLIINGSSGLMRIIFRWSKLWRLTVAILISAGLFSAFHFIGAFGETYNLSIFIYRGFAGILLGTLYVARGFGITAYAHMFYDFIVVFNLTTV